MATQGSARQLFQRLQGPVEEDALKSHLEKIILIERKYQLRKSQVCLLIVRSVPNILYMHSI